MWGQPGVNLGSTWGQHGVNLGSTWGQPGVNLGSTGGQPKVNMGSTCTGLPCRMTVSIGRCGGVGVSDRSFQREIQDSTKGAWGQGLTLAHFQLNLSTFNRIGGASRGCVAHVKEVLGGV